MRTVVTRASSTLETGLIEPKQTPSAAPAIALLVCSNRHEECAPAPVYEQHDCLGTFHNLLEIPLTS